MHYYIDASRSGDGTFTFVPYEDGEFRHNKAVVGTGFPYDGVVVGQFHPDGPEGVFDWHKRDIKNIHRLYRGVCPEDCEEEHSHTAPCATWCECNQ